MARAPRPGREALRLAAELHRAFGAWAKTAGWEWKTLIEAVRPGDPGPAPHESKVIRIYLTGEDGSALTRLLRMAARPRRSRVDTLLGTAQVAERIGVPPGTIRSWKLRTGPQKHPFPEPDANLAGGTWYWYPDTVDTWKAEQDDIDAQDRSRQAGRRGHGTPGKRRRPEPPADDLLVPWPLSGRCHCPATRYRRVPVVARLALSQAARTAHSGRGASQPAHPARLADQPAREGEGKCADWLGHRRPARFRSAGGPAGIDGELVLQLAAPGSPQGTIASTATAEIRRMPRRLPRPLPGRQVRASRR